MPKNARHTIRTAATEARTRGLERLRKPFARGILILIAKLLRRKPPSFSQTHGGPERYLLVLRRLYLLKSLYPFIHRIGGKVQIDRVHRHIHVDMVVD